MKSKIFILLATLACGFALVSRASAQTPKVDFPAASPGCTLKQRVGLTDITVEYSRPSVKGRTIFGGIVPYGQVWRTGANEATRVTFSTDVKLDGQEVPAGSYALFTIPGEDEWTVILSKNSKQFGAFQYDAKDDLIRFKVAPVQLEETIDTFTIEFNHIRDDSSELNLIWDKTVVPMKIEIELTGKLVPQIEAAMAAPGKKSDGFYFQAATFYYNHDQDLSKALAWANAGLADHSGMAFEILHLKAQILAKQGDKTGAIAAAKESSELSIKAEGPDNSFVKMNQDLINSLSE